MDNPVVAAVALVVAIVGGLALGFVARGFVAAQAVRGAQDKAARIVAAARTQQKDLILEAKDEKLRFQREAEDEARAKRVWPSFDDKRLTSWNALTITALAERAMSFIPPANEKPSADVADERR